MKKKVLIVGGGFGGIKAALDLAGHPAYRVTLLSDRPDFRYYPTLYRTATGGSRVISTIPLAELFDDKAVNLRIDRAERLDRKHKLLTTAGGQKLDYDILIFALGTITNYFNIQGMEQYSYGIKSLEEAEELKKHLHQQLLDTGKPDTNYVIVGGGPTGVELAGDIVGYMYRIMKQHGLKKRKIHVDLVEGSPRVMPRMPAGVSRKIQRRLRRLGVKLYLGKPVQAETGSSLRIGGKEINSHTVVWTAGMANNPFFAANNFMLNKNGKVMVDNLLQAWPGVFVIGDNADTKYSGMAQTALHDAQYVARNLKRHAAGKRPWAYKPKRPVYVTPVGPRWAAVVWGPLHIYGYPGYLLRRLADWIGYHDVEPWWQATHRLMADAEREDNCSFCAAHAADHA